jgi:hypothetical protein
VTTDQLDRAAVAARFGIKAASAMRAVKRGSLPTPDGWIGREPWWWATTLDEWQRPGRTGRPRKS